MQFHRLAFFGTPDISRDILEKLINAQLPNYKVELVVTNPPAKVGRKQVLTKSPVHKLAEEHGIKVITPRKIDQSFIDELRTHKISLAIVVAYGKILPSKLLDKTRFGFINIHYSLLPKLRGAAPYRFSILNGDSATGITVSKIVPALDAGEIFWQKRVAIDECENANTLLGKLNRVATQNIVTITRRFVRSIRKYYPEHFLREQDENKATYANFENSPNAPTVLRKEDGRINLSWPVEKIDRHIRAFVGFPTSFTFINSDSKEYRLIITRATIVTNLPYDPPLKINTQDNTLEINEVYAGQLKPLAAGQVKADGHTVKLSFGHKSTENKFLVIEEFKVIEAQ
jgi:methionyl-tRNA formyltransferase